MTSNRQPLITEYDLSGIILRLVIHAEALAKMKYLFWDRYCSAESFEHYTLGKGQRQHFT